MGGSSSQTQQTSQQTTPYAPAAGALSGILGNVGGVSPALTGTETGALNQLSANAGNGASQFSPGITGTANSLLAGGGANSTDPMINAAYQQYQTQMNPYASGQMGGLDSPQMKALLGTIQSDVGNSVNGQFAAAGRDMSGMNQQTLARGISQGEAAPLLAQYNQDQQNQLGAISGLFGAGGAAASQLAGNQQNYNTNQQAGITAADQATQAQNYGPMQQLAIEAQRRDIPLQTMAQQMGIVLPAAQAFGTTSGTSNTQTQMSPVQQFATVAGGLGSLFRSPARTS